MDNIAAKTATKGGNSGVVLERLDKYPEGKDFDFENGIVQWPPKVSPVPVKPVFLDVAWNFIEYPGDGGPRAVVETKEKESKAETKKGGFLGSLWGR
jgi:signal recognition particle subunit SRP68